MRITRFDARRDPAILAACWHLVTDSQRAEQHSDQPAWSLPAFTAKWADGFDGSPQETWTAAGPDGELAGCCLLTLPDQVNRTQAVVVLRVAPQRRRAGTGTALLAHCAQRAALAGRTTILAHTWDDSPGAAFAAAAGARPGIADVHRTLRLDDKARAAWPGLRREAEARAAGYSLACWEGPASGELLGQVAAVRAAMADAPRDPGTEQFRWDGAAVARLEQSLTEHGLTLFTVAARHEATGELAGFTQMIVDPAAPDCGIQQVTAVRPQHRGHRLGLLVKVAMLELLAGRAPSVRRVVTDNAGANDHMIAINDRLGFAVSGVTRRWFLDVPAPAG
jgi:GNAT superfamily N-acetyltransferase